MARSFPDRAARAVRPTTADYCDHLITAPIVQTPMAAKPCEMIDGANTPEPISFETDVGGRLGLFVERYSAIEMQDLIAYWKFTHRFLVPPILVNTDPYLTTFCVKQEIRRSHARVRWKVILFLFIIAMREGWCDMDLRLDSFFMHFPQRTNEVLWYPGIEVRRANLADPQLNRPKPTTLIEALEDCDYADPWRTHFRLQLADHPARRIARLAGKYFNMAVQTAAAPAPTP
ncbi:hypothetical protein PHMEG_00022533 [Phytophthora megakarya]|uniref:Uncharacterized protein n=1 Tax=Phytophthora megakarya TaxID=4795 RepID=A0A225VIF7_9STRA|nr:hypothetical protein PHMEG_00022533 [Phytophthora megakarya]